MHQNQRTPEVKGGAIEYALVDETRLEDREVGGPKLDMAGMGQIWTRAAQSWICCFKAGYGRVKSGYGRSKLDNNTTLIDNPLVDDPLKDPSYVEPGISTPQKTLPELTN